MGVERQIRIDGTRVHRPAKPWTPTVQLLLAHLHGQSLPVPEPLGFDTETEQVRLLPGDAGADAWPHQLSLDGVRSAGRLLRRIHDATATWQPPADAVWSVPASGASVLCHGDPQPANFAWQDGRATGLFDWDAARPGERIDDIAYALEWFTPFGTDTEELARRGFAGVPDRPGRIAALLDGYGWDTEFDVVAEVTRRRHRAIDEVVWLGRQGHEPHATWVAEGWPERWRTGMADAWTGP